jgi:hypothetical protein
MTEQHFLDRRIALHPQTGTLSLNFLRKGAVSPRTWTPMRSTTAGVHYHLNGTPHRLTLTGSDVSFGVSENLVTFSRHDDHLHLDWSWTVVEDSLEGWLEVTNRGNSPVVLDQLDVIQAERLDLPGPVADWRIYQNGWQSWTPAGVRRANDGPFPRPNSEEYRIKHLPHSDAPHSGRPHRDRPHRGRLRSEWVTVIAAITEPEESSSPLTEPLPNSAHLLVGFVTGADQLAEIILDADDQSCTLTAVCYIDGISLEPGESLPSERLRIATGSDGWGTLEAWAERMGALMKARIPEKTPTGWCTWYYYFGHNTAQDVYANLGAIRRHHLPLELVLVDDGYQAAIGDWLTPNADRFTDMAVVATTIRREGRIPGIWTAPFGLAAESQTWASHPDWAIRDEGDEPVLAWNHLGQPVYALDTTHPDVTEWLHATFRVMRHEWGYDAFKVDFLFAASLRGRRYDPRITRAQALRRGLAIIRDAIGEDAFLLGCGTPLGPAVGLVDSMRIGPDVSPTWEPLLDSDLAAPGTANALRNTITRAYTHLRLWVADPDCLLARPRGDGSQLTHYEAHTQATVLALTGGMLFDSDRVDKLPPSRLALLRKTLPPTDRIAYPLDLFERDPPEILVLPVERPWGHWWLVGLVNWEDHTRIATRVEAAALGMPPGRYHVYDQWRAKYLGQIEESIALPHQRPHETFLLLFKPVTDRPDWLTSTFHLIAGSVEVVDVIRQRMGERRLKLVVHMEQRGENFGRLVFSVPPGWVVLDAQVNGRRRSVNVRNREAGLVDMGFTLHDRAWALVDFARV